MSAFVLDTHVLVWFMSADPKLSKRAKDICASRDNVLFLPAIAILETCNLIDRGRSSIRRADYLYSIQHDPRIRIIPIDMQCAIVASQLENLPEIHDRLIVASALVARHMHPDVALVTCDAHIRQTQYIPLIWD